MPCYSDTNPVRQAFTTVLKATTANGPKYKFGVKVPRNVKHALEIDKKNGTKGWGDSISLELNQLKDCKTFKVVPDGERMPPGCNRIPYHIVMDVKFDG